MPGPVFGAGDAPLKPGALSLKPTSSFLKWFSGPWPFQSQISTGIEDLRVDSMEPGPYVEGDRVDGMETRAGLVWLLPQTWPVNWT